FVGVLLVGILLVAGMLKKRTARALRVSLWPLLLMFLGVAVISVWASPYRAAAMDGLRMFVTACTFFALTLVFMSRRDSLRTLTTVILVSVTIGSIMSILGYVFNIPAFVMNVQSAALNYKRGLGGTGAANNFAAYVIFSLPLAAHGIRSAHRLSGKAVYAILFIVNLVAVILTYSRGAAVTLAITLLLMLLTSLPRLRTHHLGLVGGLLGSAILAIVLIVPGSYWERQRSVVSMGDPSVSRRFSYIQAAREAFTKRPLIGHGIGTFGKVYADSSFVRMRGRTLHLDESERAAHNTYLEILIGTGAVGMAIFLAVVGGAFFSFGRGIRRLRLRGMEETASAFVAYRLSFVSLLIFFLVLSSVYHKYLWVCIALSQVALVLAAAPTGQGEDEGADRTQ
ncbi:MAG: O-antigen ligase family protein, partial [Lentisphaerae bacterium]|nr:O-antigen ligase family protein [Lentisphaerota bacterium]